MNENLKASQPIMTGKNRSEPNTAAHKAQNTDPHNRLHACPSFPLPNHFIFISYLYHLLLLLVVVKSLYPTTWNFAHTAIPNNNMRSYCNSNLYTIPYQPFSQCKICN